MEQINEYCQCQYQTIRSDKKNWCVNCNKPIQLSDRENVTGRFIIEFNKASKIGKGDKEELRKTLLITYLSGI